MNRLRNTGIFALLWLALSATVFGAPITVTLTNIGQDYSIMGGGEFHATVNGYTSIQMFCVDWQNYLNTTSYDAYISDATDLSKTRYGNTASSDFLVDAGGLTAMQRYTMAAWLVTQYSLNPANILQDSLTQEAIWNLLTQSTAGTNPPGYGETLVNDVITNALVHKDDAAIRSQLRVVTSVSSNSYTSGQQEFVFLTNVPEPATFVLLGSALVALGALRRKRS